METAEAELCFPHLLNSSCKKPQTDTTEAYIIYVFFTVISFLTTTLNLLVIISIAHFRQLHSATNFILLSLAISDFLMGLVVIPVFGLMWRTCWFMGDIMCAVYYLFPVALTAGSVGTVVLISADRYVAITDPLHYQTIMTDKVVNISISSCWIYAFIFSVFISFDNLNNPGKYKSCQGECVVLFPKEADLLLIFIIPVVTIIVLYIRVFVVAVSQARAMRFRVTAITSKTSKKSELKAAKNLGIVVLVYLMCYCPYYCVAYSGTNILVLGTPIEMVMLLLMLINSCLNPLIYAMLYPWFRKTIELIVTLKILRSRSCDFMIL